jgi:hypothetical protein
MGFKFNPLSGEFDFVSAGGGGGVTSVTATGPIMSSGGTTPNISISSTAFANQFLSNLQSPTAINQSLLAGTDNTFNIGAIGATRFKDLFLSDTVTAGSSPILVSNLFGANLPGFSQFGNGTASRFFAGSTDAGGSPSCAFGMLHETNGSVGNPSGTYWIGTASTGDISLIQWKATPATFIEPITFQFSTGNILYAGINQLWSTNASGSIGDGAGHDPLDVHAFGQLFFGPNSLPIYGPSATSMFFGVKPTAFTGIFDVALGGGNNLTSGSFDLFAGYQAGLHVTTSNNIVALGRSAGQQNSPDGQVSVGSLAGQGATAGGLYLGFMAGIADTSAENSNTFIGHLSAQTTVSGIRNTGVGFGVMPGLTSGTSNLAFGYNSGFALTTGSSNILISGSAAISTGMANVVIGQNAGTTLTTGSFNILLNGDVESASRIQTLVVGQVGKPISDFYIGTGVVGDAARPFSMHMTGLAGLNQDASGNVFNLSGAQGTGTGDGGPVIIQVAPAGSSSSTQNPLLNTLEIDTNGDVKVLRGNLYYKGLKGGYTATAIDYTVLSTDFIVGVTNTVTPRNITLPSAASFKAGGILNVKDESGGAATNNITIVGTVDGSVNPFISANYGVMRLYSNGSAWFSL